MEGPLARPRSVLTSLSCHHTWMTDTGRTLRACGRRPGQYPRGLGTWWLDSKAVASRKAHPEQEGTVSQVTPGLVSWPPAPGIARPVRKSERRSVPLYRRRCSLATAPLIWGADSGARLAAGCPCHRPSARPGSAHSRLARVLSPSPLIRPAGYQGPSRAGGQGELGKDPRLLPLGLSSTPLSPFLPGGGSSLLTQKKARPRPRPLPTQGGRSARSFVSSTWLSLAELLSEC